MLLGIGLLAMVAGECRSAETITATFTNDASSSESPASLVGIPADPPDAINDPLEVEVRLASEADVSKGEELKPGEAITKGLAGFIIFGLGGPGLAIYALGSLTLAVVGPFDSLALENQFAIVTSILKTPDFTNRIRKALLEGLRSDPETIGRPGKLAVLITNFGLQATGAKPEVFNTHVAMCFVVHAQMLVEQNGKEIRREDIDIGSSLRSRDAPPPVCAELSKFAENDGALLRTVLSESADVLAGIVMARLESKR
jgi:hypothetical protein